MSYWKKIMEGFSYKTKSGAPDFTNPNHRLLLRKELLNSGWNENAVNAMLSNLTEDKRTEFLKSLGDTGVNNSQNNPIKVSTAYNYTKDHNKWSEYAGKAFAAALKIIGKSKNPESKNALRAKGYYVDEKGNIKKSDKLSQLVDPKKKKKKEKGKAKAGDPIRATDSLDDKVTQSKLNAEKTANTLKAKQDTLTALQAEKPPNQSKIRRAEAAVRKAEQNNEKAQYSKNQMESIQDILKDDEPSPDRIREAVDESVRRVREDGVAQPGGIAASNGESACCNAANKVAENYDNNKIGSTKDHTGKTISDKEQQDAFDNEKSSTKKIEFAIQLGLVKLCEKGSENCPNGYKPDPMDEKTQRSIGLELEKRNRFVKEEYARVVAGDSEIAQEINTAIAQKNEACQIADSKACKDATKKLATKEKNLKEWLETGFDTGREMIDDIVHDRDENGSPGHYNAPENFPNDELNKKNKTPVSAIMSPEMQALYRGMLEKKLEKCKFKSGKEKEKCKEHYEGELKNFDGGLSDHDTGMMYYDADGNLRFVNISNKKTRDTGKGESRAGAGDEDRNEVAGGIDPQFNGTPLNRTNTVMESIDSMVEENDNSPNPEFPNFGKIGRQVGSTLVKGYQKAFDLSTDASRNVTELQIADGQTSSMVGVTKDANGNTQPSQDAQVLGDEGLSTNLPPVGKEDVYYNELANHKETKAKLKELYGDGPYTRAQVLSAGIELMKDPSKDLPYKPFGKIVEKYGEVYNDIKEKIDDGKWTKEQIAEKWGISVEMVDQILNSKAMEDCGTLKTRRQNSMREAHQEVVNSTKGSDEEWFETEEGKAWREKNPNSNGPYMQTYVREYMKNMNWNKYIDNLDGKKQLQIGGQNVQPKDVRECLAELSGFDTEKNDLTTAEGRTALRRHLERTVDIDADTGAVNIRGEGGASIGYDTWRTAGTSPKCAAGPGPDLRKCLRGKNNTKKANRRGTKE